MPDEAELLAADMSDAERMIASGGQVAHTTVRGLLAAIRRLDRQRRQAYAETDERVEAMARAMAIGDDYDGCFERVDEWEAQDAWERQAHPENRPGTDYEDCEWWRRRARAALAALREMERD